MSAEQTIAGVLDQHFVTIHALTDPIGPPGEFRCSCGRKYGFSTSATAHVAQMVSAALSLPAAQPHPGISSRDEWAVVWESNGNYFETGSLRSAVELSELTPGTYSAQRTVASYPDVATPWERVGL